MKINFTEATLYNLEAFEGQTPSGNVILKYNGKEWLNKYGTEEEYNKLFKEVQIIEEEKKTIKKYECNNVYVNNKYFSDKLFSIDVKVDLSGIHTGRIIAYFSSKIGENKEIYEEMKRRFDKYTIKEIIVEEQKVDFILEPLPNYIFYIEYKNQIEKPVAQRLIERSYNSYFNDIDKLSKYEKKIYKEEYWGPLEGLEKFLSNYMDKIFKLSYPDFLVKKSKASIKVFNSFNDKLNLKNDEEIERWFNSIMIEKTNYPSQVIYYGPPGTGKSYELYSKLSKENTYRVTFYPDFEYGDFIGSIMPKVKNSKIIYEFTPGIFTLALHDALKNDNKEINLVIEEMSRGNCSAIFGDIFQLLDRDNTGKSYYGINNENIKNYLNKEGINVEKIYLPPNFNIYGTVNTSDQNVYPMDTAFKRRFESKYIGVEFSEFDKLDDTEYNKAKFGKYEWKDFYMYLNNFIIEELEMEEDKQIGPFFLKARDTTNKLIIYLWNDIDKANYITDKKILNSNKKQLSEFLNYDSEKNFDDIFSKEFIEYIK